MAAPGVPSRPVDPSDRALTIDRQAAEAGAVSLRLSGELDAHTAPDLEAALDAAIEDGATVEVDLAEVSFVDSSGLAALLDARSRLDQRGGSLRVTDASVAVERLFTMTGVARHLMGSDAPGPDAPGSDGTGSG